MLAKDVKKEKQQQRTILLPYNPDVFPASWGTTFCQRRTTSSSLTWIISICPVPLDIQGHIFRWAFAAQQPVIHREQLHKF